MRIRTINPTFWESLSTGELADSVRLLYIATWNMCDDEGLISPWSAGECNAVAFRHQTYTLEQVQAFMDELVATEHIVTYKSVVNNQPLAWIPTFNCHQAINKPLLSKLPPPPLKDERVLRAYYKRHKGICCACGEFISLDDAADLSDVIAQRIGKGQHPTNILLAHPDCQAVKGKVPKGAKPKKAKKPTWLTPYAEVWMDVYGGQMAFARVAKPLKALEDEHGAKKTLSAFKNYCEEIPAKFQPSVFKFRSTFSSWAGEDAKEVKDEGSTEWE